MKFLGSQKNFLLSITTILTSITIARSLTATNHITASRIFLIPLWIGILFLIGYVIVHWPTMED